VLSSSTAHKGRLLARRPWLAAGWRHAINDPEYLPTISRRWEAWERATARRCDRVIVCSEVDAARLGPGAVAIPNCYRTPVTPAGRRRPPGSRLRIGFVGLLDYQPNFDAARWFATAVFPHVRRAERGATLELIGQGGRAVQRLSRLPGVNVHGYVEDLEDRLSDLSVVVAPIRFGGGTRFKILEAFAHEIPVVTTTVGCEGLEVRDGEHLLVRDEPGAFARAVVDAHRDAGLRRRLVTAGARLHAARYTWEGGVQAVRRQVAALAPTVEAA